MRAQSNSLPGFSPSRQGMAWLVLSMALTACGIWSDTARPPLDEFRLQRPRRDLARSVPLAATASDELAGSLSPDGRQLVYSSDQKGNPDIWIRDLTTGLPRRLTRDETEDSQPAWAPDGRSIVFVSRRKDAKGDLYLWRKGSLRRLTDARTADAHPVFTPDGSAVLFASGQVGRTRIERLSLRSGRRDALSPWRADHPAVSSDGRLLAYTYFDKQGRGRIRVQRLADGHQWTASAPDYVAGFPTFSPDGRYLAFCRFFRGPPNEPRSTRAVASLWRLPVSAVTSGLPVERLAGQLEQLTADDVGALLPRWHKNGIVLTRQRSGQLDVVLIPPTGLVPRASAPALLQLAQRLADPWQRLLVLRAASRQAAERPKALYLLARGYLQLSELAKADAVLGRLSNVRLQASSARLYRGLARIERLLMQVKRAQGEEPSVKRRAAQHVLDRLTALMPELKQGLKPAQAVQLTMHGRLYLGALQETLGHIEQAAANYQHLLDSGAEPALAARARLRLGTLFERLRDRQAVTRYYLATFDAFPQQVQQLEQAARAVVRLHAELPPTRQLAQLRQLVDHYRRHGLFVLIATRQLARIYDKQGRVELAVRALDSALRHYRRDSSVVTEAIFELGRLSLRLSDRLRAEKRPGEALQYYDKALAAYERLMRGADRSSEAYARARREHLRLSLLDAAQREREGERALALKRYRRLLRTDRQLIRAHRALIRLQVRAAQSTGDKTLDRGVPRALWQRYYQRWKDDSADDAAAYGLGYLATWRQPLEPRDLDQAERWLKRAIALRPQSPFGHMTLGWVYEMRERYFGAAGQGWLEEAILAYTRAHDLNDARLDPQTEAELLVNLANSFVSLGSSWQEVSEFCRQRRELGYPFARRDRRAFFGLSCGRAASAQGDYDRASESFEEALKLARQLELEGLQTELTARLALNEHVRGDYAASNRYFALVLPRLRQRGPRLSLAAIQRTMAYNDLLLGEQSKARSRLAEARQALRRNGAAATPNFESVATKAEPSTLPLGLDRLAERYAQQALEEIVEENQRDWHRAAALYRDRIRLQQQRAARRQDVELSRETALLRNRLALAAWRVADSATLRQQLDQATQQLDQATQQLGASAETVPATFAIEVGLALNATDAELYPDRLTTKQRLLALRGRLSTLERRRAEWVEQQQRPLISERLRLALWTDLALILLRSAGLKPSETTSATTDGDAADALTGLANKMARQLAGSANTAAATVKSALKDIQWQSAALALLQRVYQQTDPQLAAVEEPQIAQQLVLGPAAPLWQPLSAQQRLRWHVQAALNLAQVAVIGVAPQALRSHSSSDILSRVARLGINNDLGALKFLVSAELAYRRRDLHAMELAVQGFIERHPLLLGREYLLGAEMIRGRLFGRAIALALEKEQPAAALAFAELQERRAFVDALVAATPTGATPAARQALSALLGKARAYRQQYAQQQPTTDEQHQQQRWQRLQAAARAVREALAALQRNAPTVARLITVGQWSLAALRDQLGPRAVAVRAISNGDAVVLVGVRGDKQQAVALQRIKMSLPQLAALDRRALVAQLLPYVKRLSDGAQRVYLDLGTIDAKLESAVAPSGVQVVKLSTLWELLDTRPLRRPVLPGTALLVSDGNSKAAKASSKGMKISVASTVGRLERACEDQGIAIVAAPVRFLGGSVANVAWELGESRRFRPAHALGQPIPCDLMLLTDVVFSGPLRRAQRIALTRLLHSLGVPTVGLAEKTQPVQRALAVARAQPEGGLRQAAARSGWLLQGDGGIPLGEAKQWLPQRLKQTVFAGAAAFNATPRRLPETVQQLSLSLRLMRALDNNQYLGGALLYLANAHAFQDDYARAVRPMQRLVRLRATELQAAKGKDQGTQLKAKAQYVTALRQMAWLRLRNEQFDAALQASSGAIAIYEEVGRPALAQGSYEQRSIINERKGAYKAAVDDARKSLALAEQVAKSKADVSASMTAARCALRVAVLLRQRFSRFSAAAEQVQRAISLLPPAQPRQVAELLRTLNAMAQDDKAADKEAVARRQQLSARLHVARQLVEVHRDAILEQARIATARSIYAEAVRLVQGLLKQLELAGLAADSALLELSNNFYYMGAYRQVLRVAERGLQVRETIPLGHVKFLNAKGTALAALGRTDAALKVLRRALKMARAQHSDEETAASHNNVGNALRLAGRYREARRSFDAALELDRRRNDRLGLSFDLANRGLTNELLGLTQEARRDLRRALEIGAEIGAPINQLKALEGLARMRLLTPDRQHAAKLAQRGLALAHKLGLRNWTWRFQLLLGRAYHALNRPQQAKQVLEAAATDLDLKPPGQAGATEAAAQPLDVYNELIDVLAGQGDARAALSVAERLRARRLIDIVGRHAEQVGDGHVREQLAQMVRLIADLEATRSEQMRAAAKSTRSRREALQQSERQLLQRLARARQAVAAVNPRLLQLVESDVPDQAQLSTVLPQHAAMVILHVTSKQLVAWTVRRTESDQPPELTMATVPLDREQLRAVVQQLQQEIAHFHDVTATVQQLYDWLLRSALKDVKAKRLVIVADGLLAQVPCAILHDGKQYLLDRFALSTAPSLVSLRMTGQATVANSRQAWVSFSWSGSPDQPLPFTARESQALGRTAREVEVFQGPAATKTDLLRGLPHASNIHLASHTVSNTEDPLRSGWRLHDGIVTALDILGLRLQQPLALLSACGDGTDEHRSRAPTNLLARALLIAGARQVVRASWRVSDLAAALLMKRFFRQLQRIADPVQALRAAQLSLRQRYPHPSFWGGFGVSGAAE